MVAAELSMRSHARLSLRESQARGVTSIRLLEKASPAGKSSFPHAEAPLSATPALVWRGREDKVMWGVDYTIA